MLKEDIEIITSRDVKGRGKLESEIIGINMYKFPDSLGQKRLMVGLSLD